MRELLLDVEVWSISFLGRIAFQLLQEKEYDIAY